MDSWPAPFDSPEALRAGLAGAGYLADPGLATAGFLAARLHRPVFLEGDAGVGKTAFATTLAQVAAVRPYHTEVFSIGTRLTRLTGPLRLREASAAIGAAGATIPDWRGGTRLGDSLWTFLARYGHRGTARGAVVVVFSDGWERGSPELLGAAAARLSRLAYRLLWVTPHRDRPGFAPTAGGLAATLPHLDALVAGHSAAALTELVRLLGQRKGAR